MLNTRDTDKEGFAIIAHNELDLILERIIGVERPHEMPAPVIKDLHFLFKIDQLRRMVIKSPSYRIGPIPCCCRNHYFFLLKTSTCFFFHPKHIFLFCHEKHPKRTLGCFCIPKESEITSS